MVISRCSSAQKTCREAEKKAIEDSFDEYKIPSQPTCAIPGEFEKHWRMINPSDKDIDPGPIGLIGFIEGNIADSSNEEVCGDVLQSALFHIFTRPQQLAKVLGKRQNRKTGQFIKNYKKPMPNPDKSSNKIIPRQLPKFTRHNHKKAQEKVFCQPLW